MSGANSRGGTETPSSRGYRSMLALKAGEVSSEDVVCHLDWIAIRLRALDEDELHFGLMAVEIAERDELREFLRVLGPSRETEARETESPSE